MKQFHHIIHGNCLEVMASMPENSVDSIVTDSPYGIRFMNKHWDHSVPGVDVWRQAYRVLKPGGHMLVACGTRTQHRMVVNIEDAGFEIRDVICWHYGSGFPKNMDIGKAIDREAGVEREVTGRREHPTLKDKDKLTEPKSAAHATDSEWSREWDITAPATEDAKTWNGWGTALKPATEFWTLCRKPISERTVAANILKWGTGGINIDGCRIGLEGEKPPTGSAKRVFASNEYSEDKAYGDNTETSPLGRFPANLILDEYTSELMDQQAPKTGGFAPVKSGQKGEKTDGIYGKFENNGDDGRTFYGGELSGASRFFYCAKADRGERNKGLEGFQKKPLNWSSGTQNPGSFQSEGTDKSSQNFHPTVKPINLMRWLVRLITPPGGHVLDPYNGSGSTGVGAKMEWMSYTGIEMVKEYCEISEARLAAWHAEPRQTSLF